MSISNLNDIHTNNIKCNTIEASEFKASNGFSIYAQDIQTTMTIPTIGNVQTFTKLLALGKYAIVYFETASFTLISTTTSLKLNYAGVSTPNVDIYTSFGTCTWVSSTDSVVGQLVSTDVGQTYISGSFKTGSLGVGKLIGSYMIQLA